MNYLIIDTETKNKLDDPFPSFEKIENMPQIKQVAWQIYSDEKILLEERNKYINEESSSSNILTSLRLLIDDLTKYKPIIVGHNIKFDKCVIGAELLRQKIYNYLLDYSSICTMRQTIDFCSLPNLKYPSLQELHITLFGSEFEGAHDALHDVKATSKCFFEIKKKIVLTAKDDPIKNYPKYDDYISKLRSDRKFANYKSIALIELISIFRYMDKKMSTQEEITFLFKNYTNTDLYKRPMNDLTLNELQKKFYFYYESELIDFFNLRSIISEFEIKVKSTGIQPLIGTSLHFHNSLSGLPKCKEDSQAIMDAFVDYVFLYEIWLLKNEKGVQTSTPKSITINDILLKLKSTPNLIDPDKVLTLLMGLFPGLNNSKISLNEKAFETNLQELEEMIKIVKPKILNMFLLMEYLNFLTELEKYSPSSFKNRIVNLRLFLIGKGKLL